MPQSETPTQPTTEEQDKRGHAGSNKGTCPRYSGIAFDRNVEENELPGLFASSFDWKDLVSDNFMCLHAIGAFQSGKGDDGDPDTDTPYVGHGYDQYDAFVIYKAPFWELPQTPENKVVIHEMGHCFGMDEQYQPPTCYMKSPITGVRFCAGCLDKIRSKEW